MTATSAALTPPADAIPPVRHPDAPAPGEPLGAHYEYCFGCGGGQPHGLHLEARAGVTGVTVDTANRLQGREYDVTVVLHPLSGRPDATAFHLETGRLCVLASRHRHACVVVCRAGVTDLLDAHPSTEPVQLGVAVSFPDGWEANHAVLSHLEEHRVTWTP